MPSAEKEEEKDCLQHVKKDEREREKTTNWQYESRRNSTETHTHTHRGICCFIHKIDVVRLIAEVDVEMEVIVVVVGTLNSDCFPLFPSLLCLLLLPFANRK